MFGYLSFNATLLIHNVLFDRAEICGRLIYVYNGRYYLLIVGPGDQRLLHLMSTIMDC